MNQIPNIDETHNTGEVEEVLEELWYKIAEWNNAQPEDIDRYAENVEKFINHQLQKAREEERERIIKIAEGIKKMHKDVLQYLTPTNHESDTKHRGDT